MSLAFTVFIVFLILKLTNVIDWSWWWVTSPLWLGLAFIVLTILFCMFLGVFSAVGLSLLTL